MSFRQSCKINNIVRSLKKLIWSDCSLNATLNTFLVGYTLKAIKLLIMYN